MHSSVQRKDSGNKKSKSYKDLPLFVEKPGCAIQEATGFLAYSE